MDLPPGVTHIIDTRERDIGAFTVHRVLPAPQRRQVGPWTFVDHMGPRELAAGEATDVKPHPHIGLATVTYLYDGELVHRDSLGTVQPIRPGDLNWMTAGRGIVHSERTAPELRAQARRFHGLQLWVALPDDHEEDEPSFQHLAAASIPESVVDGVRLRTLAGTAYGMTSPARVLSPLFFVDATLPAGAGLRLPGGHGERAVYVVEGAIRFEDDRASHGRMLVFAEDADPAITADGPARLALLGGASLGPRHIFWNFVSSSRDRIARASDDWRERRFPAIPGDDVEFVPLPEPMHHH